MLGFAVAAVIFVADQFTKWLMIGPLNLREQINGDTFGQIYLLPIFNLTWIENNGISFGLLNATNPTGRWLLVAMTGAIAAGVAWWLTREKQRGDQIALGLVLGGALGNIVDRVRFGYVVDFIDVHFREFHFWVFNVADAAISIGVVILLIRAFLAGKEQPTEIQEHA